MEKLTSLLSRLFFLSAFVLLALVLIERVAYATGYTILRGKGANLLEVTAVLLVFVIAIQLREMKEELKRKG